MRAVAGYAGKDVITERLLKRNGEHRSHDRPEVGTTLVRACAA
jgi:hypothetical protein